MTLKSPMQRFFEAIEGHDSCWIWTGMKMKKGYGHFWDGRKQVTAHRYIYEKLFGKVPKGMVLDHECKNPGCVNPLHLTVTTHQVNILLGIGIAAENARKSQCKNGHHFSGENTDFRIYKGRVTRVCKTCRRDKQNRYTARKRLEKKSKPAIMNEP